MENDKLTQMKTEFRHELTERMIPFWSRLRDGENGGYYGFVDHDLRIDRRADKGCILNSRILWFFSEAARILQDESCLENARHAYVFLRDHFLDRASGGVCWSVTFDGRVKDDTRHVYCQAFAIYGLCAWYRASGDPSALEEAFSLYRVIEERMRDPGGYGEAYDRAFRPLSNEKLSENGVQAERTMNTLLHVLEAYTLLLEVSGDPAVRDSLRACLNILYEKMYDPASGRLKVFFDRSYHSLIDLWSCGHDIEAAWLADRAAFFADDPALGRKIGEMTERLEDRVYAEAFDGHSLPMEFENGKPNARREWWIQAEAVNGFLNAWRKRPDQEHFADAAMQIWQFIREHVTDPREGSEWFGTVSADGTPVPGQPLAGPWKCPYHNGRMFLKLLDPGDGCA